MTGYSTNIETDTLDNENFRKVLYTAPHSQLVLMTLQPGEEIGIEHHALSDGVAVVVTAGTEHNVVNTSDSEPLRLYTIYSPAEHPDGTVHRTKAEADAAEKKHHRA